MTEHWKIAETRKICKELNIRYMIKNDALYIYKASYGRYIQVCYNILNFATKEEIKRMILFSK